MRQLSIEKEAQQWRGSPELIDRTQEAVLACRHATDKMIRLSRMKQATPNRSAQLAEAINHQLRAFMSAARRLDIFCAAMDAGEAKHFNAWLATINRHRPQ